MSVSLLLSAVIAALIGFTFLRGLWPGSVAYGPYRLVVAALAVGIGLGITSLGLSVWLLLAGSASRGLIGAELGLLASLSIRVLLRRSHRPQAEGLEHPAPAPLGAWSRPVTVAFAVTVCCAVAAFIGLSVSQPHGGWDAWMDWNLRARLIFRSGPEWRDAFSALLPWSHPDYPLLVQASVVRTWVYRGGETLAGPALVAGLFIFATAALATSAVAALRGRTQGMVAGLVLLTTPFFIFHGASQYGDVPVGFFFLSTVVLLALHDRHGEQTSVFAGLGGLTAGLAAWTKNEGLLFLAALVCGWAVAGLRAGLARQMLREARSFALGLLPMLLVIAYFKLGFAPPNDLMTAVRGGEMLDWVRDPRRYALVAQAFTTQITSFGFNGLIGTVWLLILYGLCVGVAREEARRRWVFTTGASLILMLGGHAVVFVATAEDVARLLNSSLERLLLQLWPAVVFAWFVVLATPEEASRHDAEKAAANAS
jgi:hypothetical protein